MGSCGCSKSGFGCSQKVVWVLGKTNGFMDGQIDLVTSLWSGRARQYAEYMRASFWLGGCKRNWNWGAIEKLSNLGRGKGVDFEFNLNSWRPNGEYLIGVYCYPDY